MYKVIGDCYVTECGQGFEPVELHECATETEAREWIERYTRFGDWGGYDVLIVDCSEWGYVDSYEREEV